MDKIERKRAAALQYNQADDRAPKLTAKGAGIIADKIIEIAKAHNIYIKEDADLVEVLAKLDLHQEIPEELYRIVAELLTELYKINSSYKKRGTVNA